MTILMTVAFIAILAAGTLPMPDMSGFFRR